MKNREKLTTEKRNPASRNIDKLDSLGIVDCIQNEDARIASAVAKERKRIAQTVDLIVEAINSGGKLFYVGAGTSGRLGVLDASECPPTFGVKPSLVQGIIAGGKKALTRSVEGGEDSAEDGADAIHKNKARSCDIVIGIAACGLTPYVRGAMRQARSIGCKTAFITCAPEVKKLLKVDVVINPVVGPEVVAGSTRMKAGTATKLVLNSLTTATMIKLGKVYGNLMVDVKTTNEKLHDRAERIVMEITGLKKIKARRLLERAEGEVKAAIVMEMKRLDYRQAKQRLQKAKQVLHVALD
jgi:N-acetylmuramic acid 6-phosphate etherase